MALLLREALRVGKIAYSDYFFSISMTKQEAKKRIGDEIRNFSVITEPGATKTTLVVWRSCWTCTYTCKHTLPQNCAFLSCTDYVCWLDSRVCPRFVGFVPLLRARQDRIRTFSQDVTC
jgi:hypothetical protein